MLHTPQHGLRLKNSLINPRCQFIKALYLFPSHPLLPLQIKTVIASVLVPDFVEVHAQSLAAVQAYCPWLAQFQIYSQLPNSTQNAEAFIQAMQSSVELNVPLFEKGTPPRVGVAGGGRAP